MARRKTYPGNIEERGSSLRVRLMVDGEMHRYTLNGATKKDAREFLREKKQELQERADKGLPKGTEVPTFSEAADAYRRRKLPDLADGSRRIYRSVIDCAQKYFDDEGDPQIDRITPDVITAFLYWRRNHSLSGASREDPISKRTLNRDRDILSSLFSEIAVPRYMEANPVSASKRWSPEDRDPVLLSEDQYEGLLSAAQAHSQMLRTYVLLLGEAGLRCRSEAPYVQWDDLDLEEGFLWVDSERDRTKSGEGRWVPLTARLRSALKSHKKEFQEQTYGGTQSRWILHHTTPNRWAAPGDRIRNPKTAFREACCQAELPERFVAHDLRHRRITKWLADGGNPVHVKEAVGHSKLETTMQYQHLARKHLKSLVEEPGREEVGQLTE